jgi:hypothetical protein
MKNLTTAFWIILGVNILPSFCEGAERTLQEMFDEAKASSGARYRDAATELLSRTGAKTFLQQVEQTAIPASAESRIAHILLARMQHSSVFKEFQICLSDFRKRNKDRGQQGFFANQTLQFVRRGPESKYVAVGVGWEPLPAETNRPTKIIMRQRKYEQQEKYTEADVKAGIARNAAARQAVLEHFLKFLDEGDAYEQSEMVDLINRLWGRERIKRDKDLAVIDNVPDADLLIEAVFKDGSRPEAARMQAAFCLPGSKQPEAQAFMLSVVTNNPTAYQQSHDMVRRALAYLESTASTNTLAVLKNEITAPLWKREKIEKSIHAIEIRQAEKTKPANR